MKSLIFIFVGGLLFGFGLAMSTLVQPEIVLSFLHLEDLGLALTMAAALAIALPVYQFAPRLRSSPPAGPTYEQFPRRIAPKHIIGGAIFGVGWGIAGMCPGAAIASVGVGNWPILVGLAGIAIGAYLQGLLAGHADRRASAPA